MDTASLSRAAAVAAAAAACALAAAPARAAIHGFPNFAGTCALEGTARFSTPVTLDPAETEMTLESGPGSTCTGTLRHGTVVVGRGTFPVRQTARAKLQASCLGHAVRGAATLLEFLDANGEVLLADGTHPLRIDAVLDSIAVTSAQAFVLTGGRPPQYADSTRARGRLDFAAGEDQLRACGGAGLGTVPWSASLATGPSRTTAGAITDVLAARTRS